MKYLITSVETYRVDTENEAKALIEEAKTDSHSILSKYTSEYKERKAKGEVVDEYFKVTLTRQFTDIKEPESQVTISYEVV
jgi:hypothetical protein